MAALATLVGFVVSACGGSSAKSSDGAAAPSSDKASQSGSGEKSSGGSAKSPDTHPCDFVTKAEAEMIIGEPIKEPGPSVSAGGCKYEASGASSNKETIIVFAESADQGPLDRARARAKNPQVVSGVGDAAFCDADTVAGQNVVQTIVYSKSKKLIVSITGDSCDEDKLFGQKALSRL